MSPLTYITIGIAVLAAVVLFVLVLLRRRGIRPQLSKEDQATVAGLHEVGSRTGSRYGTAENMNEETLGHHGGAESSGGDAGGGGGE